METIVSILPEMNLVMSAELDNEELDELLDYSQRRGISLETIIRTKCGSTMSSLVDILDIVISPGKLLDKIDPIIILDLLSLYKVIILTYDNSNGNHQFAIILYDNLYYLIHSFLGHFEAIMYVFNKISIQEILIKLNKLYDVCENTFKEIFRVNAILNKPVEFTINLPKQPIKSLDLLKYIF
jgi:hypothetical protein